METNLKRRDDRPVGADPMQRFCCRSFWGPFRCGWGPPLRELTCTKPQVQKNAVAPNFAVSRANTMSTPEKYASNQRNFRATTIAMVVLAVLFTGFRFLARWKKGLTPGVDDYMLVVALVCNIDQHYMHD